MGLDKALGHRVESLGCPVRGQDLDSAQDMLQSYACEGEIKGSAGFVPVGSRPRRLRAGQSLGRRRDTGTGRGWERPVLPARGEPPALQPEPRDRRGTASREC